LEYCTFLLPDGRKFERSAYVRGALRGEFEGARAYEGRARGHCVEGGDGEVAVWGAESGQGIGCGIADEE